MRTPTTLARIALAAMLCLVTAACTPGKKADGDKAADEPLVVEDRAADSGDEPTGDTAGDTDAAAEEVEGEAPVTPSRRAGGPLALVCDDELCSILVSERTEGGLALEICNNASEDLTVSAAEGSFAVDGSAAEARLSVGVAPEETVQATLELAGTDAASLAQATVTGELVVTGADGTPRATYPLTVD